METYKNDYTKKEDPLLWEIHEIRREMSDDIKKKSVDQINSDALEKYADWRKQADEMNEIAS